VRPGYPVRADRTNCPSARCPCAKARLALGEVSSPLGLHAVVGSTVLELLQFAKSDTSVPSLALPVTDHAVLQFSHDIRDGINEVIQLARTRGYTKRAQLRNDWIMTLLAMSLPHSCTPTIQRCGRVSSRRRKPKPSRPADLVSY
jgi:hypothetical protein